MYSFSYLEPVCCSMSTSNCSFLTWIQVFQEADQMVWYSHLFQNFPQFIVIHTVKGFGIVNKPEIDVFLELSCFFHDPADVGNLISGSSAFSNSLYFFPSSRWLPLSSFSRVRLCATPETAAHQAPPSLGFSRQEHWSGLPFPSPMHESEKWKWSRSVVSDS